MITFVRDATYLFQRRHVHASMTMRRGSKRYLGLMFFLIAITVLQPGTLVAVGQLKAEPRTLVYSDFHNHSLTNWSIGGVHFQKSYVEIHNGSAYGYNGNVLWLSTGSMLGDKTYGLRNIESVGPNVVAVELWFLIENASSVKDFEVSAEMVYNGSLYEASVNWSSYWGNPRWRYWDEASWHDVPGGTMNLVQRTWHHFVLVVDYFRTV